ncbi:ubiquinol-cytochrome c reductase complex assembly factor 2 [Leptinotarsa decemlineata]|uniref:ubiquinol-cytochrome c reductase complex assembly factor 2 n=1 Tax=Leptinotarsa decemlineata TaxID=7539 RepID=UPI003D3096B7
MASTAGKYKRMLQLLDKWPADKNKSNGRDIGDYLRKYLSSALEENKFQGNSSYWDRQYLAVQKLVSNAHKSKYKRAASSSATGLSAEECNAILSDECLNEIKKQEKSFFRSLISLK